MRVLPVPELGLVTQGKDQVVAEPADDGGVVRGRVEEGLGGETTTVLIKTPEGDDTHYVALSVLDGFEANMTKSFLAARPQGGEAIGTFPSKDEALAKARTLCPA